MKSSAEVLVESVWTREVDSARYVALLSVVFGGANERTPACEARVREINSAGDQGVLSTPIVQ
jgi:hypothetical protein